MPVPPIPHKYPKRDSNSQKPVSKTGMYANFHHSGIIKHRLLQTDGVSLTRINILRNRRSRNVQPIYLYAAQKKSLPIRGRGSVMIRYTDMKQ